MDLTKTNQAIKNLSKISEEEKESILRLIDLKTDDDMEKVLKAIQVLDHRISTIEKLTYGVLIVVTIGIFLAIFSTVLK